MLSVTPARCTLSPLTEIVYPEMWGKRVKLYQLFFSYSFLFWHVKGAATSQREIILEWGLGAVMVFATNFSALQQSNCCNTWMSFIIRFPIFGVRYGLVIIVGQPEADENSDHYGGVAVNWLFRSPERRAKIVYHFRTMKLSTSSTQFGRYSDDFY